MKITMAPWDSVKETEFDRTNSSSSQKELIEIWSRLDCLLGILLENLKGPGHPRSTVW